MKITDEELLELIWHEQLRHIAKNVRGKYVGGRYGLHEESYLWVDSATQLQLCARTSITKEISAGHLLVRLKKMISEGKLTDIKRSGLYRIEEEKYPEIYEAAVSFWVDKGLPRPTNGSVNPIEMTVEDAITIGRDCGAMLIDAFGKLH